LITSNAFYGVLTPSTHGDFIAYVSLLGSYGVWTRFPSTFVVGMFSKQWHLRGTEKIKDVEVQGGILQDLHDVMYMSINHGKTIDDFKECGRVVVRKSLHKHKLGDAWTNYFWTYYHQFGK
jgi:hypothetical protein